MEQIIYKIKKNIELNNIIEQLNTKFTNTDIKTTRQVKISYYDTFDARLLKNGLYLTGTENRYQLHYFTGRVITFESDTTPGFASSLPDQINSILENILELRSLLPIIVFNIKETEFALLNEDKKTVARGIFKNIITETNKDACNCTIELKPIRGYIKELNKAETCLKKFGRKISINNNIKALFSESSIISPDYINKPTFDLKPKMKSYDAIVVILKTLTDIFKINEQGILNDYDTEFLHDYRVSIRKIRSLLGQLSPLFNAETLTKHTSDLKEIAGKTNRLRDMDVYLNSQNCYFSMLPEHLHNDLELFFVDVANKRTKENKIVSKMLLSKAYSSKINSWLTFLSSETTKNRGAEAEIPILELSNKYIYKRYFKILKQGEQVKPDSDDELFHKVRISCKKLRYLLETFSSLHPEKEIKAAVKQLKLIQDCLGNFNDMCVQQEHLNDYLHNLSANKTDTTKVAAAIGGLISATYNKKIQYRDEFYSKFHEFADNKNRALYKKLFMNKGL